MRRKDEARGPHQPQEAADRIRAASPDLVAEGAKAHEWARKTYDWSVIGPQLEALLLDRTEGPTA